LALPFHDLGTSPVLLDDLASEEERPGAEGVHRVRIFPLDLEQEERQLRALLRLLVSTHCMNK
jgi:hypothetical protein